ncbi:MAG: 50S ribosomal protein L13 [Acidimicrobiia bacterium]|nr:50S ribosomal protein L13 [Acidimicrobiia bacterium]
MGTYQPKASEIQREWLVIDAADHVLGRIATQAAHLLRGKHKATWVPHMDCGDNIIIINSDKIDFSVRKGLDKKYNFHSGYPGGLRTLSLDQMMEKDSRKVIELAITGMLPHGRLGRTMIEKLHVYKGSEHPHIAQDPKPFVIESQKPADKKVKA